MSDRDIRCMVTGATGYIGSRLTPRLLDRGYTVRALARRPEKLADVPWRERVEVVRGDLTDAESLADAFDGMDVVYYLVHSMGTSPDFVAAEARSAHNVVEAAQRAGVKRLVYLSGLHPAAAQLSPHLQSRAAVGDILVDSGIEAVVLQAGIVIGSGSASFEMIRHLTDRLPAMTTPKWVHNRIQPIAIGDVLHYLAEAATADVPTSRTWDIGGPDVLEYGDAMQVYAEVAGLRRRLIIVLPLLTPTIASWWVGLVTPIPSGLARPLVESLEYDAVMADHDVDEVIRPPDDGLIGYRDAVEEAVNLGPLPSDPQWAGEVGYALKDSAWTPAAPEQLWKAVEARPLERGWQVETREPGRLLRLRFAGRLGHAAVEMLVHPASGGSLYEQRAVFYPRGTVGLVAWHAAKPLYHRRFHQSIAEVVDAAQRG